MQFPEEGCVIVADDIAISEEGCVIASDVIAISRHDIAMA
jgi:hypothetical protein